MDAHSGDGSPSGTIPRTLDGVEEGRLVGVTAERVPVYYGDDERRLLHAERRDGVWAPDWTTERYLPEGESPADAIRRIDDAVGWRSITAFGEQLLDRGGEEGEDGREKDREDGRKRGGEDGREKDREDEEDADSE